MVSVGIRELKASASEIMRRVEEEGETIEVTRRGKVIGKIVPAETTRSAESIKAFWERVDKLRQQLAADLGPEPIDAVELVREQRRNLTPDEWVPPDYRGES